MLFKIILGLFIFFWLLRAILKYFARTLIGSFMGEQKNDTKKTKTRKTGDIHIDKQPARDKKIKDNVGEYIDYEEIK